ncbi:hypothetical protein jhhlp_001045 [Lomentospora prolificans]|uniref:Ribophorin II n=1 Tax=Lomentospora prolificans TaxID=41688 RepID=A0A2N3NK68_9PEZI|nr:hypothetical protein jhhlp_001045 [Lomentospora prolificans]
MRFLQSLSTVLLAASTAYAASSWGFDDATVAVKSKKGNEATHKLNQKAALAQPLALDSTDSIKVILTIKENGKAKKPHQAFVIVKEEDTGLEAPFAFTVKESGKAVVEIPHKELPVQLVSSKKPLHASIVIGSFGSSQGLVTPLFDIDLVVNPNVAPPKYEKPIRYGKLAEIHHIFKDPEKTPPKVVSLVFTLTVLATIPALFVGVSLFTSIPDFKMVFANSDTSQWFALGANLSHLQPALSAAPLSHAVFFGSIVAMEGAFFMYYKSWTLGQLLPAVGAIGTISFLSGTKALGEVQSRRLAGER